MTQATESISDLTAIIKTFERPKCLDRLICSIRKYYPRLRIVVADDGFQPSPRDDVDYLRLPPDVGVSAGRNAALGLVRTPYFLLLDDDLCFTEQTKIERLLAVARRSPGVIAGGTYLRCKLKFGLWVKRRPQPYHGTFERSGDRLTMHRGWHRQHDDHYLCDIVHNFFVARTDEVRAMGAWNPLITLHEHEEFFLRAQQAGLQAAYCPEVVAEHWNANASRKYYRHRNRKAQPLAFALHGIRTFVSPDGKALAVPPLESITNSAATDSEHKYESSSTRQRHVA
jgi:GT2 family glycosyltransferase